MTQGTSYKLQNVGKINLQNVAIIILLVDCTYIKRCVSFTINYIEEHFNVFYLCYQRSRTWLLPSSSSYPESKII